MGNMSTMYLRNHSKKETKEWRVKVEPVINVTRLSFYVILSNICECGVAGGAGGRVSGPVTSAAPLRLWSHVAGRMLPSRSYQPSSHSPQHSTSRCKPNLSQYTNNIADNGSGNGGVCSQLCNIGVFWWLSENFETIDYQFWTPLEAFFLSTLNWTGLKVNNFVL